MGSFYNNLVNSIIVFRIGVSLSLLAIIFLVGTIGYHFIEDISFFDGFYMTFITITTIGFSEITDLSHEGRLLTVIISLVGIGIIAYIASQTTQLIFESEIFRERILRRKIKNMDNHFIICGYGRIGQRIARVLNNENIPLVIIENRPEIVENIKEDNFLYIMGNAEEEDVLLKAGIKSAQGVVCTLSRDQDNVFVTLIARELNDDVFILARTNQHKNTRKLLRAGANKVISPYEIGADRMANVILRPNVNLFVNKIMGMEQDQVFDEIKVFEGSQLAGKTIAEAQIRQQFFVVIISIIP